jgi:outer membrane receptor protein involved in Fe transport
VSPKFALSYKLTPEQMLYVSATKGFRVGGANEPVPGAICQGDLQATNGGLQPKPSFNPDSIWSYEAGYKALLLDRKVSLDASIYRINWTDIQQNITLPDCGFQYTANFGSARSQGVELELSATPVHGLTLRGDVSYDDGKLTSNTFGPPALSGPSAGQSAIYALSGDRIPFTPAWTGSISATYTAPVTGDINAYARADFQYQGKYTRTTPPGEVGYDPLLYSADAYHYSSARFGATRGNWDVSLFCNNLSNARPVIGKSDSLTPGTGISVETSLMPRVFGLTVDRKF